MGSTVASVPVALAAVPPTDRADSAATIVPGPVAKRRGTIDVSDVSGSAVTSSPRPQLPYLEIPSRALPGGSPSTANGVTPTTIDSAPVAATGKITPSASNPGWAGFSFADTGFQPPDPWVAAGPDHVVQTVNTSIQMFDRQGNVERAATEISVGDFFNLPPDFGNSDPRVIYDSLHGRWIGTEVSWTCDGNRDTVTDDPIGYLDFIVSRTADPTGLWDLYYFGFLDELPDYPAAGTSTDKLAFTANHFTLQPTATCTSGSMYLGTSVIVTDWVDALAAGGSNGLIDSTLISFEDAGDFTAYFTARASLQVPATSSTLQVVVGHFNGVTLSPYYATVTGTVAAGNMAIPLDMDLTAAAIVGASTVPPPPLQPGTPAIVTTAIDFRPTDAIWQASRLSWVSTNGCTPTGDSVVRSCVRVTQVNTGLAPASPPTLAQDFLIAENGKHNFYGGIGQSGNGTLHVVWTRSSDTAGDQPSSMTAYHLLGDPANTLSPTEELAPGTGTAYTGGRWGDYVGVAQDPQVPNAVWQANQYATGGPNWATKVSQLQTGGATYVPIDPLRVVDSRIPLGVSGIFNASAPRTFQVAGVGTIPAGAIAVTGNVTVVGQTAAGYVSITTTATSTPRSSTLNFPSGDTRANNLTASLASNGTLAAVYKAAAGKKAHVIFDVTGYFLPGTTKAVYNTVTPVRVLDTRTPIGLAGRFVSGIPRQLTVGGVGAIPANAVAITANLTVVGQTKGGFVSVTPTSVANPTTSNLNFPTGDVRANGLTAKLTAGKLWLVYRAAAGAQTHLILDVTGYYLAAGAGLAFFPLDPGRIMDTRSTVLTGLTGLFSASVPRTLDTDGHWGVPAGAAAVTGNLTVVSQTAAGYVSITPTPLVNPTTSTLNFPLGDTRANGVTVPLNGGNMSLVYKAGSGKKTHLILDVTGYFD
jgi:hypothetical protein